MQKKEKGEVISEAEEWEDMEQTTERDAKNGESQETETGKPKMKKIFQQRDDSMKVVLKADTIGRLETLVGLCDTLCNEGSIDVRYFC